MPVLELGNIVCSPRAPTLHRDPPQLAQLVPDEHALHAVDSSFVGREWAVNMRTSAGLTKIHRKDASKAQVRERKGS